MKPKKQSETTTKRKHNKTASKYSTGDNAMKQTISESVSNEQRINYKKSLKSMLNNLMKNEFSKRSLPFPPAQQLKTARKKKIKTKSELKAGQSEYLLRRKSHDDGDRFCIEKIASIKSINNSIFKSEED